MKKINFCFVGEGYEKVDSSQQYPKWDFKLNPQLECVLRSRKQLPAKINGGNPYYLFEVIEKASKTIYSFFPGKVLVDKLTKLPDLSAVKIVFLGVEPVKRYHKFDVFVDRSFKYDPAVWEKPEYQQVQEQPSEFERKPAEGSIGVAFDDLPF